jgi:hypothetical protein
MPSSQQVHWGASDAYERYLGRWSRKVAPLFTTWFRVSSGAEWIDIGSGEFDPKAREFDDGVKEPVCRPSPLRQSLQRSGLHGVEVRPLDIPMAFESFDDYWAPFLGGTESAPTYCASLPPEARERLRDALSRRLPMGPDGEILLAARAWAVKGRVAGA